MQTSKQTLNELASNAVFSSLENFGHSEIDPYPLYLPSRKWVQCNGYQVVNPNFFSGSPEQHYFHFYNVKTLPEMNDYYLTNAPTRISTVYRLPEETRHRVVRNSVFYFGHVKYKYRNVCANFIAEDYESVVDTFNSYFKVPPTTVKQIYNAFPKYPGFRFLRRYKNMDSDTYYYELDTEFARNVDSAYYYLFEDHTKRYLRDDLKCSKVDALFRWEIDKARDSLKEIMPKVVHYLLMVAYSKYALGHIENPSTLLCGLKTEEDLAPRESN